MDSQGVGRGAARAAPRERALLFVASAAAAAAGDTNIKVASVTPFAVGQVIAVDTGAQSEQATAGQNPTTRAIAGLKVHTVTDGDSLQSVAYQNYGDATRWRKIAEANGIDNPFALRRGSQLTIPTIDA